MFYSYLTPEMERTLAENQTILYAFSYPLDDAWYGKSQHKILPKEGVIVKDINRIGGYYFANLKKDGTPRATGVTTCSRYYADNYKEAVQKYNELIDERKLELQEKIKQLEQEKHNLQEEILRMDEDKL